MEIPNIQKQRKHLAKLVLDMDSSRTRWQQTSKSSGLSSSLQPAGAKADALREEMEEAANRVEICRDQLSADMYSFVAKEIDYANYFQTLIEVQAEYHRKSLTLLQAVLPQIKAQQGKCRPPLELGGWGTCLPSWMRTALPTSALLGKLCLEKLVDLSELVFTSDPKLSSSLHTSRAVSWVCVGWLSH